MTTREIKKFLQGLLKSEKEIRGNYVFLGLIKPQFGKKMLYIVMYFEAFKNSCCLIISENVWLSLTFFLDFLDNSPC